MEEVDKYVEYVTAQLKSGHSANEMREDLKARGLMQQQVEEVMSFVEIQMDTIDNKGMFKRPFSFEGRIRRLEYWLSYLIMYAYIFVVAFLLAMMGVGDENGFVVFIFLIPAYWFAFAQNAKRCHDRGNSRWYQLIPFYGLWLLFGDGDEYDNGYGSDPKGRNLYN